MEGKNDPFLEKRSRKKGIWGILESSLRRVRPVAFMGFFLFIAAIGILCIGLSLGFSITVYSHLSYLTEATASPLKPFTQGILIALGFFTYGIAIIFIAPLFNLMFGLKYLVKPFRGSTYSLEAIPWFLHNALIYVVRYSFLEFLTPSPLNVLFYKMMGMKIGKGVVINTSNISDACLIELGDYVTIGGSAHLVSHYSQSGYLIVSRIKIGRKSTVAIKATVLGDVVIGENCLIKPHSVALPKTRLESGSKL